MRTFVRSVVHVRYADSMIRFIKLKAFEHKFTKGFQHQRGEMHTQDRTSTVSFLGNKQAGDCWPINRLTDDKIRQAFGESHHATGF